MRWDPFDTVDGCPVSDDSTHPAVHVRPTFSVRRSNHTNTPRRSDRGLTVIDSGGTGRLDQQRPADSNSRGAHAVATPGRRGMVMVRGSECPRRHEFIDERFRYHSRR